MITLFSFYHYILISKFIINKSIQHPVAVFKNGCNADTDNDKSDKTLMVTFYTNNNVHDYIAPHNIMVQPQETITIPTKAKFIKINSVSVCRKGLDETFYMLIPFQSYISNGCRNTSLDAKGCVCNIMPGTAFPKAPTPLR